MSLPWSSKGSKGTPINADELLILDSADANPSTTNKRITIGSLPSVETVTWTANHDAAGFDLLNAGGITINNPADSFQYIVTPGAITADRILNIPVLTGTDTLVTEAFAQTLTNKTIAAAGNTLTIASTDLTDTAVIVRTDQTNTFGDFAQIFPDNQLFIQNPATTFEYQIIADAIVADRTLTFPLLTGNDTLVTEAHTATLTNKTVNLTDNTVTGTTAEFNTALSDGDFATLAGIESLTNKTFDNTNEFEDNGLIIQNPSNTFNYIFQSGAIAADRTATLPLLIGNDTLVFEAHIQTLTNKTFDNTNEFLDDGLIIQNPANTFNYIFQSAAIAADRTLNLPLMTGTDTLVLNDFTATLTNKTLGATNTVNAALTWNEFRQIFNPSATIAGINVGAHTTNPSIPVDGDIWYNSTSGQLFGRANGTNVDLGAAGAGAPPFADSTSIVEGSIDPTKEIRFEVDGLTTATTRVITVPDADITLVNTSDGLITDTNVDAAAAIVTSKLADAANFVLINQANTYGDFAQTFADNQLFIQNPAATFEFQISAPGIAADRTITLPLLTGNDTFVTEAFIQTLTNKTLDNTNEFLDDGLIIQNPADTFNYIIQSSAIVAARTATLPLLTGNDTFVFEAHAQTLTNKTIAAAGNTLTIASTDLTDTGVIVRTDQTNTFGDFAQIIPDNQLFIQNPAATFEYQIIADAIAADRTVTLPLLTGNDTLVTEAFAQTLTNKTLGTATSFSIDFTLNDGVDVILNTTTGSTFGTATTQKLSFYGVAPVVQPTALTATLTTLTNAGTASDFAIQALTSTTPFGFVTQAEGETVVEVVLNNQARLNEIETKLQALGLLA